MDDNEYNSIVQETLENLGDWLEQVTSWEVDVLDGVLSISTNNGEYIINRHRPSLKIWLSSPLSGPNYFAYAQIDSNWYDDNGIELSKFISTELGITKL
ncbi:MAG: frataxin family protein [Pseudomonadota bacterium]